MTTVLLTGFEPFDGETVNPSWQAVRRLGELWVELPVQGVSLRLAEVPCVFGVAGRRLAELVVEHEPDLVICVGQAGGRRQVTPERVAVNVDDADIPDNAGNQPIDEPIVPGGPAAYFASIPVKAAVAAMRDAGVPAAVSQTAGTFVCNHLFYHLMHLIATEHPGVRGGFVHVPYAPEQVVDKDAASLSVETIAHGLLGVVTASLATVEDIVVVGGATH
jgi:pyroglutamyl-peptidase